MSNNDSIEHIHENKINELQENEIQRNTKSKTKIEKIIKLLRKYTSIINFYKYLIIKNFNKELKKNSVIIQSNYRKYLLKINFKRNLVYMKILDNIQRNVITLQKNVRRFLVFHSIKSKVKGKKSNYYMIYGDKNRLIDEKFSRLRLIKYDYVKGEDKMNYYKFEYVKLLDQYILFLPKRDINKENTLVNFIADDNIIINKNFPVYKYGNKNYYNVLKLSQLSNKSMINASEENEFFSNNRISLGKLINVKNYNIIYANDPIKKFHNSGNSSKRNHSSLNIKQILNFNPILKEPSQNVLHSTRSSSKRVSFQFD